MLEDILQMPRSEHTHGFTLGLPYAVAESPVMSDYLTSSKYILPEDDGDKRIFKAIEYYMERNRVAIH